MILTNKINKIIIIVIMQKFENNFWFFIKGSMCNIFGIHISTVIENT